MGKARAFEDLLRAGRWFGGLDEDFRGALLDAAVVRHLEKGDALFSRGDAANGMYALVTGGIRIVRSGGRGPRALLMVVEPPMWFGEMSIFDREPRSHDAVATHESTIVHVHQTEAEAILARDPRRWRDLGALASGRLRLMFSVLEDAGRPIAVRLARRLVLSAERYGDWYDRSSRVVDVRQDQLAIMLSTSRQTVNQVLKRFERAGLVRLSYGQIEIIDLGGLRDAAGAPLPRRPSGG